MEDFSPELPRELIHDWPLYADCCPEGDAPEGLVPIEERTDAAGRRVVALYRHKLCGREWVTTWLLAADEPAVLGVFAEADLIDLDAL